MLGIVWQRLHYHQTSIEKRKEVYLDANQIYQIIYKIS